MKYTIFQVDDSRQHYVDAIRRELSMWDGWDEVKTECVDGRIPEQLAAAQAKHPYEIVENRTMGFPLKGHLGIWYTVLNALEQAPIVTFEDDAILLDYFGFEFMQRMKHLPNDADFFALFIPRDSDHMCLPRHDFGSTKLCRIYQPYGGVSMYYTEQGAKKIKKLLERDGLTDQYDNRLMNYAWHGELNGYTSKPSYPDLVRITGEETSIVQETEYAGTSTD
jgi:hypothetical protein